MPFQMTENTGRLLPLRMKISPSITSSSDQCSPVEAKMIRPSSVSEFRSVEEKTTLLQRASTPLELTIRCPLSSSVLDEVNDKRNRMFRSPSEHFLEVLEQQDKLPQIITRSRSRNSGGELTLARNSSPPVPATSRSQKTFRLQSLSSVRSSSSDSDNADTDSCSKGNNSEQTDINCIKRTSEKNYLRRVHSLPAIQPVQTTRHKISGVDSDSHNLISKTAAFRTQSLDQELSKNLQLHEKENGCITENKKRAEEHENEEQYEKFSMICNWLAQCEKAHTNDKH